MLGDNTKIGKFVLSGKTEAGSAEEQPARDILIDWNGPEEAYITSFLHFRQFHELMPKKNLFLYLIYLVRS